MRFVIGHLLQGVMIIERIKLSSGKQFAGMWQKAPIMIGQYHTHSSVIICIPYMQPCHSLGDQNQLRGFAGCLQAALGVSGKQVYTKAAVNKHGLDLIWARMRLSQGTSEPVSAQYLRGVADRTSRSQSSKNPVTYQHLFKRHNGRRGKSSDRT